MDAIYTTEQENTVKNIVHTYLDYMITQPRNSIPEYTNALASALSVYTMDQEMQLPNTLYHWVLQTYDQAATQHQWPRPSISETVYKF